MQLALESLNPPLRISSPEPLSVEEFWRFAAQHRDLRMEREANGDLRIMTPTKLNTGSRNGYIGAMLANWTYEDNRGDYFDSSTGFTLPDSSVLSPDASWVAWERLRAVDNEDVKLPLSPDFVIELRSASDNLRELREKMERWIANGVQLAWLIDPKRKAVEIYRPSQQPEVQEGHTAVYGEGSIAGFVLELGRIWS